MLTTEQILTLAGVIGSAFVGVIIYLVKSPMDASRKRAEDDAAAIRGKAEEDATTVREHNAETAKLQRQYIESQITNSTINSTANAKQASDLALQTTSISVMAAALNAVSDNTKTMNSALTEYANFGVVLIKLLPDIKDQNEAQKYLNKMISILSHHRQ